MVTADGHHPLHGSADALFDAPSRWRADAATWLGLVDEELLGALSPGAGFPAVLTSVLSALTPADGRLDVIVDVGAGIGGTSEWLRRRTSAQLVAIEPATGAREAARSLFPELVVRSGSAQATGLIDGAADALVLCGVVSLIDDIGPVLVETERLVRPGGVVAIADLFSASTDSIVARPNTFRSFERMASALAVRGWSIVQVGCGTPEPDSIWADGARRVDRRISDTHHHDPAFAAWAADKEHLERHMAIGDVVAGCIVAARAFDRPAEQPSRHERSTVPAASDDMT